MSHLTSPVVDCDIVHPVLSVPDVLEAVEFYTSKLGFSLGFVGDDPPEIAGVNLGRISVHLVKGEPNPASGAAFFVVGDADELYEFHKENSVEILHSPADMPWGLRTYSMRDLNGYELGFGHHIYNTGPAIKIERVEVPVRLEQRLAGLLKDLAEHKRMSINSCLEEILLHSFEVVGDGVASPHTKRTLRYIQELKRKHGIDYDTHGSYNFVE